MGLGSYRLVTLSEAREQALELHKLIKTGVDPLEARRKEKTAAALAVAQAMTFAECADGYFKKHSPGWKSLVWTNQFKQTMRDYVTPIIGKFSVADIDTDLVLKVLRQEIRDKEKVGEFWQSTHRRPGAHPH